MVKIAILIPVLRRPGNVLPLITSILDNTEEELFEILFLVSPGDNEEIWELENWQQSYVVMDSKHELGDYAKKINHGFNSIEAEWYFLGADDLKFHPGWFEAAMKTHDQGGSCVIGTNDLGNPSVMRGQHSTHSLVLGEYIQECGTIDQPGKILHEGYRHNFVDTELVATAQWRGAWSFSGDSRVEHLHPDWGKSSQDPTYVKGKSGWEIDRRHYETRKRLWP